MIRVWESARRHPLWSLGFMVPSLILLALAFAAWLAHYRGMARLERIQAQLRAIGRGADPDAYFAAHPPMPAPLLGKAQALFGFNSTWRGWDSENQLSERANRPFSLGASWVADQRDLQLLTDAAPGADDLRALLSDPRCEVGGGIPASQLQSKWRDDSTITPAWNQLQVRAGATYFGFAACAGISGNLDDLDRLRDALKPASRVDAYFTIDADRIRDRTYLELALLHRIDESRLDRWLAEPPTATTTARIAVGSERMLWQGRFADYLQRGVPLPEQWGWHNPLGFADWMYDADILAEDIEQAARVEAGEQVTNSTRTFSVLVPSLVLPDVMWEDMQQRMADADASHRLTRLTARVVMLARGLGRVPADQSELEQGLGKQALDDGDLYEKAGQTSFRITADLARLPPTTRARALSMLTTRRTSPALRVWMSPFGAEVDVDATPMPAPRPIPTP